MTLDSDIRELTRLCQEHRQEQRRRRRDREIAIQATIAGGVAAVLGQLALTAVFHLMDGDTKKQTEPQSAVQIQIQPVPH